MSVGGNFVQEGGSLRMQSCTAQKSGGGFHISGSFQQEGGSASFEGCSALRAGGGMDVLHNVSLAGWSTFNDCEAAEGQLLMQFVIM